MKTTQYLLSVPPAMTRDPAPRNRSKADRGGRGGYLLMLAKDETAGGRMQEYLTRQPPNPRARFVHFSLSETGQQITRS